jgi:predicted nucleic acid-binding protein
MYLLDTDVVSELRKGKTGKAHRNVSAWAKSVSASALFLSAISILELEIGILLIERRDRSQGAFLSIRLSPRDAPRCMSRPPVPNETR